ncbi:unnamed protein product [Allacma fusca]|uniref:Uncharacterized protein n=1 Tax=Allacma fusca TaxID=39272 RepID=A0A8J2PZ31_9HEXA|nr:unnamed protein product [Allacma fusca]
MIASNPTYFTKNVFNQKYSSGCSLVIYLGSVLLPQLQLIDQNWVIHIPGSTYRTFHFFFEESIPDNFWRTSFIRRLCNVLVLSKNSNESSWTLLAPNHLDGAAGFTSIGRMSSSEICINLPPHVMDRRNMFWNTWSDFRGQHLRVGAPATGADTQKAVKMYREQEIFNFDALIISEISDLLNATPKIIYSDISRGFGSKLSNGTWSSYVGKLKRDEIEISLPFSPFENQFSEILMSKVVIFSPLQFFAPLPNKQEMSLMFLVKPLDLSTWMALLLCVGANTLTFCAVTACTPSLGSANSVDTITQMIRNAGNFLNVLIDQPFPSYMLKHRRLVSGNRILCMVWLFAIIVVGNHYKSVVISILVEPILVKPPLNVDELLKSNFQLNFPMYKAFNFDERLPWIKYLKYPVRDFGTHISGVIILFICSLK